MKAIDLIKNLSNLDPDTEVACLLWTVADVLDCAHTMEVEITEGDAEDILSEVHRQRSAENGITWLTIEMAIEDLVRRKAELTK